MIAGVREWRDERRTTSTNMAVDTTTDATPATAGFASYQHVATPDAADQIPAVAAAGSNSTATTASGKTSKRKVSPVLHTPEDDNAVHMTDDDSEVDETFVALQKLLMNMEGMRRSQVTPVSAHVVQSSATHSNVAATRATTREELLEMRRREREQFRLLLLSKGGTNNSNSTSTNSRRRRPTRVSACTDDDDDDDEAPAPSVESTISNRMMNGSFSRFSVHAIARERWAREETERLPLVLLPKDGKVVSPADNPKLNVMHTSEYIELSEQLDAALQQQEAVHDTVCHLTPPRATWCIQMRDFDALHATM